MDEGQTIKTVDEAAELLLSELSDESKQNLRSMDKRDLIRLHFTYGMYVRNKLLPQGGNQAIVQDCTRRLGLKPIVLPDGREFGPIFHQDGVSAVVIEEMWKRLQGDLEQWSDASSSRRSCHPVIGIRYMLNNNECPYFVSEAGGG